MTDQPPVRSRGRVLTGLVVAVVALAVTVVALVVVVLSGRSGAEPSAGPSRSPSVTSPPLAAPMASSSPSSPGAPSTSSDVGRVLRYLDEIGPSSTHGCANLWQGPFVVGEHRLDRSVSLAAAPCADGGVNWLEYTLDPTQGCTHFSAFVGVPNSQYDKLRAALTVDVDGETVMSEPSMARAAGRQVDVTIRPDATIRLSLENTTPDAGLSPVTGVFGNAMLTCAA
ncbi:hypothetical protein ACQP00_22715 [Dactylosporangium sp. CS-047395]|uniref:hypothetical protein n=1 Tax=Dactylosporangium sp. CS-047395 TaxID=3239936 RepID=UPI003D8F31BB